MFEGSVTWTLAPELTKSINIFGFLHKMALCRPVSLYLSYTLMDTPRPSIYYAVSKLLKNIA